ncbi:hypothetical protein [Myroides odoratimimus]|uniref:DUF4352 domain-containing protein n=1 Tax=Myroides odoratimimus CIP 101113 TaxID=883154 RepID=A0AAV3EZP1_9FLAO|nr:hypothetical protein [Myroides odoratimimus]EHO06403.1 hypothetical protein HMPREF9715_03124 [Myroides odoratimimus CIP 101113]SHM14431.1 hypothetical protein SAMN05444275_109162 [Myroides odoratimimus subsp. xuanwuensis]
MPSTGDKFVVVLKNNHLGWGTYRKTNSRGKIVGESYLPIPKKYAVNFSITNKDDKSRSNVYLFSTNDGFLRNKELKASGNRKKGCKYAKNLHGNGDLKLLTPWFVHISAVKGTEIEIEFVSSTEIKLTKIK